jgi:hypothetical protein
MSTAPFTDHISDSVLLPKEDPAPYCERCGKRKADGMRDRYDDSRYICEDCLKPEEAAAGTVDVARYIEDLEDQLSLCKDVQRVARLSRENSIYKYTLLWIRNQPTPECPNAQLLGKMIHAATAALNGFRPVHLCTATDKAEARA